MAAMAPYTPAPAPLASTLGKLGLVGPMDAERSEAQIRLLYYTL